MVMVQRPRLEDLAAEDVPVLRTEIPGPRSRSIRVREEAHSAPGLSALSTLSGLAMQDGRGALIRDADDNVFIDFSSGTVVSVTGHSHPKVVARIQQELENFIHIYDYSSQTRSEFFDKLADLLPDGIDSLQMYSSGAETVEAAMRLARSFTRHHEFVSLYRAFHGKTMGALALMGGGYKKGFGPLPAGFFQTPNAYCYRCPLGLKYPSCGVACADYIADVVEQETTGDVAALVVEPIQGAGGVIVPPPEFLPKLQEYCRRNGILLHVDEILTSAGRTGKLWASEHFQVEPDIMTLGKGIGSGFPLGVVASRAEIMSATPFSQPNGATTTFGGSPVSAAAGLITLQVLAEERLVENAAVVGAHMKRRLEQMQSRHPAMGDVRGVGMLIGVELVRDRDTKRPVTAEESAQLYLELVRRGVLVAGAGQVLRITPPLVLDQRLADRGLDLFDEAMTAFEARVGIG